MTPLSTASLYRNHQLVRHPRFGVRHDIWAVNLRLVQCVRHLRILRGGDTIWAASATKHEKSEAF